MPRIHDQDFSESVDSASDARYCRQIDIMNSNSKFDCPAVIIARARKAAAFRSQREELTRRYLPEYDLPARPLGSNDAAVQKAIPSAFRLHAR